MLLVRCLVCVALSCASGAACAAECAALVGEWSWFTGGTVRLERNYTVLYDGKAAVHWSCVDDATGKASLTWNIGAVDSVSVSGDHLSGTNTQGVSVSAERHGLPHPGKTQNPPDAPLVPSAGPRVSHPPAVSEPNALQRCLGVASGQPWPKKTGPRPETLQYCQQLPGWALYEQAHQSFESGSHAEAAQRLLSAARAGNGLAAARFAIMYDRGDGVPVDKREAFHWYALAAQAGDPGAAGEVGSFYEAGAAGVPEDWIEAAKWYQQGAQLGWHKAQQSLGRAYQYGIGVPLDLSAAVDWYRRAAAAGNSQARYFAQYLQDNHGLDGSSMSEDEAALYGPSLRTLGHTIMPPSGTVFHNKSERFNYIRSGLTRIAWQEYDDCRRGPRKPADPPRTCVPPSAPRP